ncbi:MAG TPA: hypothetical protein VMQ11_13490 [Alphaproteobacteria bacterium]|nr:hypothetical protein [Alphaproteobacteria bacterium]
MIDPKDAAIRATLTEKMARMLKRRAYTERQIVQVLRLVPDKAKALLEGRLDEFSHEEIRRFIAQLD